MSAVLMKGIYENSNSNLNYVGTWGTFFKNGLTMVYSEIEGSYLEFKFSGTGFKWLTQTNSWRGKARIYIDGLEKAIIDSYSENEIMDATGYFIDTLELKEHTVKIEVLGIGNNKASEYKIIISKIEILECKTIGEYQAELNAKKNQLEKLKAIKENIENNILVLGDEITSYEIFLENIKKTEDIPVSEIKFDSNFIVLNEGGTSQLKWSFIPQNANDTEVNIASDNTGIVTVNTIGLLTYVNQGEANVTIKTSKGIEKTIKVICELEATDIILNQDTITLNEGETHQLVWTIVPENTTDKTVRFESGNIAVATVSALGLVTYVNEGETNIIVTTSNLIARSLKVISKKKIVQATSISVTEDTVTLKEGETHQLVWSITPENTTDKTVRFESGNTGFVTVSNAGLLTYVNEGETNISIITNNGIFKYVRVICKLNETNNNLDPNNGEINLIDDDTLIDFTSAIDSKSLINEGIVIANEEETIEVGEKIKIIAHTLPYDVMNTNLYVVKSSDESIIAIDKGRVIIALGVGEATITAFSMDGKYKDSIKYKVIEKQVYNISIDEIYNLELARFNIVANNNSETVAINNSLGINAAIKFCSRYGYKKLLFPSKLLIYIEATETIYMTSKVWIDLNGSELKLRANDYDSYNAILFREGNINLIDKFDFTNVQKINFLNTKNVTKTTITENKSFYSNSIIVRDEKPQSEYNQYLNYLVYGDSINCTLQIARNIIKINTTLAASANVTLYIDYYKDTSLVETQKLQDIWIASATAAMFSTANVSAILRTIKDYNNVKIRLQWTLVNSTAEVYVAKNILSKIPNLVLQNAKLMNGIVTGERDEKASVYPNWASVPSTEGGVSIIFSEGYNNGIENINVRKSVGFNMSSGLGKDSYGVVNYSSYPISYKIMELGTLDQNGQAVDSSKLIRTNSFIDISKITTPYYNIGYPLGYMGYPYVTCRIYDVCFYDVNKNFIRKDRGRLRFRRYYKPANAYYAKFIFYSSVVPTTGNTDFNGAFAFVENNEYPIKNFIRNCVIEDNYSCGLAACGGQKWKIENNIWRRNAGRMPGCDIDWEDGWEYMQDDYVSGNSFESYNNVILCAGAGQVYENNKFNGISTVYGRSQYWSIINNTIEDTIAITNGNGAKLSLSSSTDVYIEGNKYKKASIVWNTNHGATVANYNAYIKDENFDNSNVLIGEIRNISNSIFVGTFGLTSVNVTKCEILNSLITTNANIVSSNIKLTTIRPTKNSTVTLNGSYLYNSLIDPSVQANDVTINNCVISRDILGQIMTTSSNSTGGLIVNDSTFKFNALTDYQYLLGGWNSTGCIAKYTFNNCIFDLQTGFKGYLVKCSWYAVKTDTKFITLIFNNTDVSKFLKSDTKGLNSNIVYIFN